MLITGEGGTGKTRLTLEFVKYLQGNIDHETKYNIYFMNPYNDTFPTSLADNTLLILDDAGRHSMNLNKLVDLVLNSEKYGQTKLILVERSIFRNHIENIIKENNAEPEILYLKKGQIVPFLKQNFPWIDEHTAKEIEEDCRESFDYAAICAEHYHSGGKLSSLVDVLSWKTAHYIRDIAERTRKSFNRSPLLTRLHFYQNQRTG
jgi:hypothetical protein